MPEHISRKELKQDKIHDAIEHGAEAVFSHTTVIGGAVLLVVVLAAIYAGWRFYMDRQTVQATAAMDAVMKVFSARIAAAADPSDPGEPFYATEAARAEAAAQQFSDVARKYARTDPGRHAAYYAALCNEDLERHNQALEKLKKISSGSDKELAAMAQYQIGLIYERTGKPADAIKIFRDLADHSSIFVPRPLALLELAGALRQTNPTEAASVYEQLKKEFPNTAAADQADRGLETLAPKS
ncbi:MAG TPA: tetratricopeptide repeat protein [Candidatus Methylomirabilis sp.]|nr:tetratricopeptide repeat protein [Candidatus Methylomirabilis sp.]